MCTHTYMHAHTCTHMCTLIYTLSCKIISFIFLLCREFSSWMDVEICQMLFLVTMIIIIIFPLWMWRITLVDFLMEQTPLEIHIFFCIMKLTFEYFISILEFVFLRDTGLWLSFLKHPWQILASWCHGCVGPYETSWELFSLLLFLERANIRLELLLP